MGAVPKHRISSFRQGRRRAVIKLKKTATYLCPKCQKPKVSHQVCPSCGSQ